MVIVAGRDEALGQVRELRAFGSELRPAELTMVMVPVVAVGAPPSTLQLSTGEVSLLPLKSPVIVRNHLARLAHIGSLRAPRIASSGSHRPAHGGHPTRTTGVTRRRAAQTVGVVALLVLSTWLVGFGLGYAADHRYEREMGGEFSSDNDDGTAVRLGVIIAAIGLVPAAMVGVFVRRSRPRLLGSALVLALVVAVAGAWAEDHGPSHRCAFDRYGGYETCVSEAGAVQRDFALVVAPVALVNAVFWLTPRRRFGISASTEGRWVSRDRQQAEGKSLTVLQPSGRVQQIDGAAR